MIISNSNSVAIKAEREREKVPVEIRCVWEHNCNDSILYSVNFAGAFTRGETRDAAIQKMSCEIRSYLKWKGDSVPDSLEPIIVQEKDSGLAISDADTDVLFDEEWSLRKVLRRFIWHDRIHAKAMYRMAIKTFGNNVVQNVFQFDV